MATSSDHGRPLRRRSVRVQMLQDLSARLWPGGGPRYAVNRGLERLGYRLTRVYPRDFSHDTIDVIDRVRPYTRTSPEAIASLCAATEHVARTEIPGSIVECGVWRGGSMMAAALTLTRLGRDDRELVLFDTFAGMPPPTDPDVRALDALAASNPASMSPELAVPVAEVSRALATTGYPQQLLRLVEGRVEDTLPAEAPDEIALLRLDTDWYESTRHSLDHLFPRLSPGGVFIVDDYGHWQGVRRAVDEYLGQHCPRLFLGRVDYTVRLGVKP